MRALDFSEMMSSIAFFSAHDESARTRPLKGPEVRRLPLPGSSVNIYIRAHGYTAPLGPGRPRVRDRDAASLISSVSGV